MVSEYNSSTPGSRKNFRVKSIPDITADFLVLITASYALRGGKTGRRSMREEVKRGE
jgi:hypothetical protein